MAGLSKGQIDAILDDLERQGARLEGAKSSRFASDGNQRRYPVRVFPPNGSQMFAIHQTIGDVAHQRILDSQIRRSGMESPLPQSVSRKEKQLSNTVPEPSTRRPGEHLIEPPGAKSRKYPPTQSSVDKFKQIVPGLPERFWTDQAWKMLVDQGIPGYGDSTTKSSGAPMQRVQSMLDWLGYRVVDAKRNRNGFVYEWQRDPVAPVRKGVEQNPAINFQAKKVKEPVQTQPPLEQSPIAVAFQEAQQKREAEGRGIALVKHPDVKRKHERVMCEIDGQWFTPEGLERHNEDKHPQVQTFDEEVVDDDAVTPGVTEQPDPDDGRSIGQKADEVVAKSDYDALEQMATEAEERATRANDLVQRQDRLLAEAKELVERQEDTIAANTVTIDELSAMVGSLQALNQQLGQAASAAQANEDRWQMEAQEANNLLSEARGEIEKHRAKRELAEQARDAARLEVGDIDTWPIPITEGLLKTELGVVVQNAQVLGMTIEIRGRRA